MSNMEFHFNDVNGTGASNEGVASGRSHQATAEQRQKRLGWSKEKTKKRDQPRTGCAL